jgi:hypothetical protein
MVRSRFDGKKGDGKRHAVAQQAVAQPHPARRIQKPDASTVWCGAAQSANPWTRCRTDSALMTSASPALFAAAPPPLDTAERERHFWPAVWALGVGSFAIGTGEFVIMGLLPEVAKDLGVTIPQAGHVITAYALGVVVGAPVLAVLAANWPRRARISVSRP